MRSTSLYLRSGFSWEKPSSPGIALFELRASKFKNSPDPTAVYLKSTAAPEPADKTGFAWTFRFMGANEDGEVLIKLLFSLPFLPDNL